MNIILSLRRISLIVGMSAVVTSPLLVGSVASAATTSTALTTKQQQDLATIQSKGAAEITRRLTSLNTALSKISSTTKLSASDQSYLESEVNTEISGLTALQTKLAADTTDAAAIADAKSIYTEYRVYALVLPKTWLVSYADNQQTTEAKLTTLSQTLQSRITADKTAGKDITTLQNELNDIITQTNNAQAISSSIEQKVLTLQPSDYNSDNTILSGDLAQLKTAHSDNEAAYTDAKNIVSGLEALK